jgi:tetratricopeptide (TPR) repeat protein
MIFIIIFIVGGDLLMKRLCLFFSLILIFILNTIPLHAAAYSYGDPNEEKVAEIYKQMVEKLNNDPPNFDEATTIFETIKEELDMHMGTEPSEAVMNALEAKDKEAVIKDMQKILVLNIARRLDNIEKNFNEYDTSKRLLAKAFATYEALSPIVQSKNAELDKQLRDEFDRALQSLGNPGLFGVGKKESNIDDFKKSKEVILTSLQKEFKLKSLKVGHFTESATEQHDAAQKKEWTDLSKLKNWIPLIVLIAVIAGIGIYYLVKKRK